MFNPKCFRRGIGGSGGDGGGDDDDDGDDVELHVLGCRVDILGTNCDQCLSMVQCCFTSTKTVGQGAKGGHLDFHTAPSSDCGP